MDPITVVPGRVTAVVLLLIFAGLPAILALLASRGRKFQVKKKLPALDAIPEAVGRAVEMGKPVHYTPGGGTELYGARGAQVQMGLVILGFVARTCARVGAQLITSVWSSEQIPIANEIVREAFIAEGVARNEVKTDVRFYAGQGPTAYAAGCLGTMAREHVSVSMMFGSPGSELAVVTEGAQRLGALQITGCSNYFMLPIAVASSDHLLIGEELFAAGAIISESPPQLASIVATDISKLIIVGLTIVGSMLLMAGFPILALLNK